MGGAGTPARTMPTTSPNAVTLTLRPATLDDRPAVYRWLARSDATPEMMGPPRFADHPVPTWAEFCDDYDETAFSANDAFRVFVIEADGAGIGAISFFLRDRIAEIDLWIGARRHWGKGYGSTAIRQVAAGLFARDDVDALIIRPSARNVRAVAAYRRAGFVRYDPALHDFPAWISTEGLDCADAVVLVWPRPA